MDSIWNLWNYVEYMESTWNLWGSVKYTWWWCYSCCFITPQANILFGLSKRQPLVGRQIGKNSFTRPLDQEGGPSSLTQITYTSQHFSGEARISGTAQQKMGKDMVRITKERQVLENGP